MLNTNKKISVLVVDDSALMRRMIIDVLNGNPDISVTGIAINGKMALTQIEKLNPDVITLDVEMPFMNGLETLKEIRRIKSTPTIMFSSLTKAGAEVTLQALELGAVDFIQKPETDSLDSIKNELISKIKVAAESKNFKVNKHFTPKILNSSSTNKIKCNISKIKTVVIGSSTGGPQALKDVVPYIPADIHAQILIVQHMPPKFTNMLAQRLDKISQIRVKEAEDGDSLERGYALLAPGNFHMCIDNFNRIKLNQEPPVWGVRPSVDITLASAAKIYTEDLICVVLTGMGHDGSKGAGVVKKFGGYCIAQDKETSIIYGMPKSVVDAGFADEIVPLHEVANAIVKAVYK